MSSIVIIDLDAGNLRSVQKAVEHVSTASVCVTADPGVISSADHLILPGQSALGTWMSRLNADLELRTAVNGRLQQGPVLGICLGLQGLYSHSEENSGTLGFGILRGKVRHFSKIRSGTRFVIPHMGWNQVRHTRAHPLWSGIDNQQSFYFANSYFVEGESDEVVGEYEYGSWCAAAVAKNNLFATQFHPEKSGEAGLQLLQNFVNWNGMV